MSVDHGNVLLVGSVARPQDGWGAEDVLRNCGSTLGDHVSMLPDGEGGPRHLWIVYLASRIYYPNPALVLRHPREETVRSNPDWMPAGYDDQYLFRVRDAVPEVRLGELGYAREAKQSYAIFRRLREERVIAPGVRFMVALPLIESGVRRFFDQPRDFEIMWSAYAEALAREVAEIVTAIPHEDLAVQWDMVAETYAVEGTAMRFDSAGLTRLPVDALERYRLAISTMSRSIPDEVWLGLHICYGSLGQKSGSSSDTGHEREIRDLAVSVRLANEGAQAAGRRVQFVHMAVQLSNGFDPPYYAPLQGLDAGEARLYLGLVHLHDGVEGALRRIEIARRHHPHFGIATQCGWGRRPPTQRVEDLLHLERDIADAAFRSAEGDGPAGFKLGQQV
jgi:hypothetical protein